MQQKIIDQFNKRSCGKNEIVFSPDLKINRRHGILYILSIRHFHFVNSKPLYEAIVTVGTSERKLPMPLAMLDETSLKEIYLRLLEMGVKEKV